MKNARQVAFEVLVQVIESKQYVNLALKNLELERKEQALVTRLVYGTLQHFYYLEYQWSDCIVKKPPIEITILLNMALYQVLFMDKIPSYAILDEIVSISKKIHQGRYSGLINAIGRKIVLRPARLVVRENIVEKLAIETSHPSWLLYMWRKQLGWEATEAIARLNNEPPLLYCRVNELKAAYEDVISQNDFIVDDLYHKTLIATSTILQDPLFLQGKILIQDKNSQRVAYFAQVAPNESVLDMCSAPGTKTVHLAQFMNNTGVITAVELHPHRAQLVEQLLLKTGVKNTEVICADATDLPPFIKDKMYDTVFIDAPCSGLGVIRRKPDIKIRILPADLDAMEKVQKNLLAAAVSLVKVKGQIIYATCTLNRKENQNQINHFVQEYPQFQIEDEQIFLPHSTNADGFYMAKLRRIS